MWWDRFKTEDVDVEEKTIVERDYITFNNPYTNQDIIAVKSEVVNLDIATLINLRTGALGTVLRVHVNYLRITLGLEVLPKGTVCNRYLTAMWVYDQAGKLLKHLGYESL